MKKSIIRPKWRKEWEYPCPYCHKINCGIKHDPVGELYKFINKELEKPERIEGQPLPGSRLATAAERAAIIKNMGGTMVKYSGREVGDIFMLPNNQAVICPKQTEAIQ